MDVPVEVPLRTGALSWTNRHSRYLILIQIPIATRKDQAIPNSVDIYNTSLYADSRSIDSDGNSFKSEAIPILVEIYNL